MVEYLAAHGPDISLRALVQTKNRVKRRVNIQLTLSSGQKHTCKMMLMLMLTLLLIC